MGLEFMPIFKDWAAAYDDGVTGNDPEYREVFRHYQETLTTIAELAGEKVLEFGSGTGNLTAALLAKGKTVYPVEPSADMRQIAEAKPELAQVSFIDGDLEHFPIPAEVDTIVANLVFHHLTSQEKRRALRRYHELLPMGGQVIFGDTMFLSQASYDRIVEEAAAQGHQTLVADLKREYYPLMEELEEMFRNAGFDTTYQQMNRFVWIVKAVKVA